jgi:hypothetical protein
MSDKKKDPLDITDLPDKVEDTDDVRGGVASRPIVKKDDDPHCNSNTLTCKDTSKTNTLCCE